MLVTSGSRFVHILRGAHGRPLLYSSREIQKVAPKRSPLQVSSVLISLLAFVVCPLLMEQTL